MVQLSTLYVKKFENDNLTNREKTDMKGEDLSFPVVKKIFIENRLLKDIEFGGCACGKCAIVHSPRPIGPVIIQLALASVSSVGITFFRYRYIGGIIP